MNERCRRALSTALFFMVTALLLVVSLTIRNFDAKGSFTEEPLKLTFICDQKGCYPLQADQLPSAAGDGEEPLEKEKSGDLDLTADGLPERVSLDEGRLTIHSGDRFLWQSDPGWIVADFSLGDPNNDGRNDIIAAVWIENDEGDLRSHPYIIGYRRGYFRVIWGGSAVAYPIYELQIADIGSDGNQQLVVLEAAETGTGPGYNLRTLSVWDWNGWGYTLRWRSEPGFYRNLKYSALSSCSELRVEVVPGQE